METLAQTAGKLPQPLVDLPIAVVIHTVTDFVHLPCQRVADLHLPRHAVSHRMLALPQAAGRLVQLFVSRPVAVVVLPVADFLYLPCQRVADLHLPRHAVRYGMLALTQAAGRLAQLLVRLPVAVVVLPIAEIVCPGVNCSIHGRTVQLVGRQIVVVVLVTRITQGIEIGVLLLRIGDPRTVVVPIGNAVPIFVRLEAIGGAITIRVRVAFVDLQVTIVVETVARLWLGTFTSAEQLPILADLLARAGTVLIFNCAVRTTRPFVRIAVTVVVMTVTGFLCRDLRITVGQPLGQALPHTRAASCLVLYKAGRLCPGIDERFGAQTGPLSHNALHGLRTGRICAIGTQVSVRTVVIFAAWRTAKTPQGSQVRACLTGIDFVTETVSVDEAGFAQFDVRRHTDEDLIRQGWRVDHA